MVTEQLARALFRAKYPDLEVRTLKEREDDFIISGQPKGRKDPRPIPDCYFKVDKKSKKLEKWSIVSELRLKGE